MQKSGFGFCVAANRAALARTPLSPRPSPPAAGGGRIVHLVRRIGAAAAGVLLPAALGPSERGWRHCKELTETPMLTPSGRASYQISHCEKFDRGGALRAATGGVQEGSRKNAEHLKGNAECGLRIGGKRPAK